MRRNHRGIDSLHLLAALLDEKEGLAAGCLAAAGIAPSAVRDGVVLGPVEGERIVDALIYAGVKPLPFAIEQSFKPLTVASAGAADAKAAHLGGYHAQTH